MDPDTSLGDREKEDDVVILVVGLEKTGGGEELFDVSVGGREGKGDVKISDREEIFGLREKVDQESMDGISQDLGLLRRVPLEFWGLEINGLDTISEGGC